MLALSDKKVEDSDFDVTECLKDKKILGLFKGFLAQFKKQEPKATQQQEDDMPLSKEEKAELVSEITASVVAALKPAPVKMNTTVLPSRTWDLEESDSDEDEEMCFESEEQSMNNSSLSDLSDPLKNDVCT
jgi:hypothetical protein